MKKSIFKKIVVLLFMALYIVDMTVMIIYMILPLTKSYSIYEVSEVRKEIPIHIIIHFDDPSIEPKSINDVEVISKIISYYEARVYKKYKTSEPMPKSNAYLTFVYTDGVAVSVPVGDFTKYKVKTTDDLGSFIESLR